MTDDLSPVLGGGPVEWPCRPTPNIKFTPAWRRQEMHEERLRERRQMREDRERLREAHRQSMTAWGSLTGALEPTPVRDNPEGPGGIVDRMRRILG